MRYEFNEVLNDLVDYFLLGDIQLLARFKQENDLPDDLAYEFTHNDSGDQAVLEGVVLPWPASRTCPTRSFSVSMKTTRPCSKRAAACNIGAVAMYCG